MNAYTRKEAIIESICEGREITLEPKTRAEYWLKKVGKKIANPDWNTMQNKPFGEVETEVDIFQTQEIEFECGTELLSSVSDVELGKKYYLVLNDEVFEGVGTNIGAPYYCNGIVFSDVLSDVLSDGDDFEHGFTAYGWGTPGFEDYYGIKKVRLYTVSEEVKQIDEKYIPSGGGGLTVYKMSDFVTQIEETVNAGGEVITLNNNRLEVDKLPKGRYIIDNDCFNDVTRIGYNGETVGNSNIRIIGEVGHVSVVHVDNIVYLFSSIGNIKVIIREDSDAEVIPVMYNTGN